MARRFSRPPRRTPRRPESPPPPRPRDGFGQELPTRPGSITGARVRPDGTVWYRLQAGEHPGILLEVGRDEPVLAGGEAPPGRPFIPWSFHNPHGQTVSGWRIEPEGEAPFPTLVHVHGGPTSIDLDRWAPDLQAYVDAGFEVVLVNYRGSIGFGTEWRDTLIGNIGWPELEDLLAGVDDLLAHGLADPKRLAIAGWSWGGYLTLLMHGMHPDRFVSGVAGVPVGDYALGYDDLSPCSRPTTGRCSVAGRTRSPQLMAERSPISYVDDVKAPILFLAGEADSRCPFRQVMAYIDRLRARHHPHELYLFATGHAPFQIDERIQQTGVVLEFLRPDGSGHPGRRPSGSCSRARCRRRDRSRSRQTRRDRTSRPRVWDEVGGGHESAFHEIARPQITEQSSVGQGMAGRGGDRPTVGEDEVDDVMVRRRDGRGRGDHGPGDPLPIAADRPDCISDPEILDRHAACRCLDGRPPRQADRAHGLGGRRLLLNLDRAGGVDRPAGPRALGAAGRGLGKVVEPIEILSGGIEGDCLEDLPLPGRRQASACP